MIPERYRKSIEELPEECREEARSKVEAFFENDKLVNSLLLELVTVIERRRPKRLEDLNEKEIELFESLSVAMRPASDLGLFVGKQHLCLSVLETLVFGNGEPEKIATLLMLHPHGPGHISSLLNIGLAAYCQRVAEVAREAKAAKADVAASN